MKQLAAIASLIIAIGVAGAALTGALPDEQPPASSGDVDQPAPTCCGGGAALTKQASCADGECKEQTNQSGTSTVTSESLKPDAGKCEFCTEEDCEKECSSCTEARKQNIGGQTEPKATQAGVREMGHGRGMGRGMGHGHMADSQHDKDHQDFFFLLEHRDFIRRTIKNLPNGYEALTESDDPQVAKMIQVHVAAMYNRVENGNPIRMRDPIFRSIFNNADKIQMEVERTEHGVRVKETSTDAYGVKLLQEHARVVSLWIKNGYAELPKNHPAPIE